VNWKARNTRRGKKISLSKPKKGWGGGGLERETAERKVSKARMRRVEGEKTLRESSQPWRKLVEKSEDGFNESVRIIDRHYSAG